MSMTTELVLSSEEVKVGDVVTEFRNPGDPDFIKIPKPITVTGIRDGSKSGIALSALYYDGELVVIPGCGLKVKVQRTVEVHTPAASSDRWNGKCRVCGSNIYVGFSMVDHEGPCKG